MRVRLDLDTLDDAPACSQVAPPAVRAVAAAARPPQAPIPFSSTAPASVLTDGHAR
jgi:hypothetical protein